MNGLPYRVLIATMAAWAFTVSCTLVDEKFASGSEASEHPMMFSEIPVDARDIRLRYDFDDSSTWVSYSYEAGFLSGRAQHALVVLSPADIVSPGDRRPRWWPSELDTPFPGAGDCGYTYYRWLRPLPSRRIGERVPNAIATIAVHACTRRAFYWHTSEQRGDAHPALGEPEYE